MTGNWFAPTRQQLAPHRLRLNQSMMRKISSSSNSPSSNTSRNSHPSGLSPRSNVEPRREIPQIADTYVVDKVSPLRIDGRDARGSIERGSSRPRFQPPNWRRSRKSVSSVMRRGRLRAEQAYRLPIPLEVARPRFDPAVTGTLRLWHRGLCACRRRQPSEALHSIAIAFSLVFLRVTNHLFVRSKREESHQCLTLNVRRTEAADPAGEAVEVEIDHRRGKERQ
jgi:hypothetical protein